MFTLKYPGKNHLQTTEARKCIFSKIPRGESSSNSRGETYKTKNCSATTAINKLKKINYAEDFRKRFITMCGTFFERTSSVPGLKFMIICSVFPCVTPLSVSALW